MDTPVKLVKMPYYHEFSLVQIGRFWQDPRPVASCRRR